MQVQNQVYSSSCTAKNQLIKPPVSASPKISFQGAPMAPAKNKVISFFSKILSRVDHPFSLNLEFNNLSGCLKSMKKNGVSHKLVQDGKKWQSVHTYYPSGNVQYSYLFKRNNLSFINHYSDSPMTQHGENLLEEYCIKEKKQLIDYVTLRENGSPKTVLSCKRGSTTLTKFDVNENDYRKKCQGSIYIDRKGFSEMDGSGAFVGKHQNIPHEYAQMPSLLNVAGAPKKAPVYC